VCIHVSVSVCLCPCVCVLCCLACTCECFYLTNLWQFAFFDDFQYIFFVPWFLTGNCRILNHWMRDSNTRTGPMPFLWHLTSASSAAGRVTNICTTYFPLKTLKHTKQVNSYLRSESKRTITVSRHLTIDKVLSRGDQKCRRNSATPVKSFCLHTILAELTSVINIKCHFDMRLTYNYFSPRCRER
jgi:hypothetical protein